MKSVFQGSRYLKGYAWCSRERRWVIKAEAKTEGLFLRCPRCMTRLRTKPRRPKNVNTSYVAEDPATIRRFKQAVSRLHESKRGPQAPAPSPVV